MEVGRHNNFHTDCAASHCTISKDCRLIKLVDIATLEDTTLLGSFQAVGDCNQQFVLRYSWASPNTNFILKLDQYSEYNGKADLYFIPHKLGFDSTKLTAALSCFHSADVTSDTEIVVRVIQRADAVNKFCKIDVLSEVGSIRFNSTIDCVTVHVLLFDINGRALRSMERVVPSGTSEIDLGMSSLPTGCYWYVVRGDGWTKSGKVMKLP
jgi:hypothetical protein